MQCGNGRVERYQLDLEHVVLTTPTHSRGPKDRTGERLLAGQPVITLSALAAKLEAKRLEHNATVHAGRDRTPDELHDSPELALLPVTGAYLAAAALPDPHKQGYKMMDGDGLLLWGTKYIATALFGRVGDRFRLRYWPTDARPATTACADRRDREIGQLGLG